MTKKISPAPALSRGIRVLRYMDEDRQYSLEELATKLDYPKSSLLRFLDVLVEENLITRDLITKKYRPLTRLVTLSDFHFETGLDLSLKALASATGHTAEWYEHTANGMLLMRQVHPEGKEAFVQAHEGWLIPWDSTLNAVNCLGIAFYKPEIQLTTLPVNTSDGISEMLSVKEVKQRLKQAEKFGTVIDQFVNNCSVRRVAVIVQSGSNIRGILSLAEFVSRIHIDDQNKLAKVLEDHALKIS